MIKVALALAEDEKVPVGEKHLKTVSQLNKKWAGKVNSGRR